MTASFLTQFYLYGSLTPASAGARRCTRFTANTDSRAPLHAPVRSTCQCTELSVWRAFSVRKYTASDSSGSTDLDPLKRNRPASHSYQTRNDLSAPQSILPLPN